MAYFMAKVLMFLKVFLMIGKGILNLFSSEFIEGVCVVALAFTYSLRWSLERNVK